MAVTLKRTDAKRKHREEDRLMFQVIFGVLTVSHYRGDKLLAQYSAGDVAALAIKGLCENSLACYPPARFAGKPLIEVL